MSKLITQKNTLEQVTPLLRHHLVLDQDYNTMGRLNNTFSTCTIRAVSFILFRQTRMKLKKLVDRQHFSHLKLK